MWKSNICFEISFPEKTSKSLKQRVLGSQGYGLSHSTWFERIADFILEAKLFLQKYRRKGSK
jgi:hypothetical protein